MPGKDDTKMLMLIDALRSGVPIQPEGAHAYPADPEGDEMAHASRPGEVVLPTSYYDTALHKMPHQSGLPDPYDVYGAPQAEMQHLPDVTTHMDPAEMQRLPPMTVHPSLWQKLLGGRQPNAPGVRQAGDESAGY